MVHGSRLERRHPCLHECEARKCLAAPNHYRYHAAEPRGVAGRDACGPVSVNGARKSTGAQASLPASEKHENASRPRIINVTTPLNYAVLQAGMPAVQSMLVSCEW